MLSLRLYAKYILSHDHLSERQTRNFRTRHPIYTAERAFHDPDEGLHHPTILDVCLESHVLVIMRSCAFPFE